MPNLEACPEPRNLNNSFPDSPSNLRKPMHFGSDVGKPVHFRGKNRSEVVHPARPSCVLNNIPALNIITKILLASLYGLSPTATRIVYYYSPQLPIDSMSPSKGSRAPEMSGSDPYQFSPSAATARNLHLSVNFLVPAAVGKCADIVQHTARKGPYRARDHPH